MTITFTKLHPTFAAEVAGIELRNVHDAATLERIRAGMDEHAVLVFRGQPFTDAEQLAFAQRLDGELHAKTGISAVQKNRFGNEALTDISNVGEAGEITGARRSPPRLRSGQPAVAHRRIVPGSARALLDAARAGRAAGRRRHGVRGHESRLRRAARAT